MGILNMNNLTRKKYCEKFIDKKILLMFDLFIDINKGRIQQNFFISFHKKRGKASLYTACFY